jgi:hypothetical protein
MECEHLMLFLGTHPDFRKGWVCRDCGNFVDLCKQNWDEGTLHMPLDKYAVVFAAIRKDDNKCQIRS